MSKILIVGGGIAGLTLANFLARNQVEFELIERSREWKPVGAGIGLAGNALKVLEEIDLLDSLIKKGCQMRSTNIITASGKTLMSVSYDYLKQFYKLPMLTIHRGDLHTILRSNISPEFVRTGITISEMNQSEDHARVKFSDGSESSYKIIIGADGIHSQVREIIFGKTPLRYSGYTCWRFIIPNVIDFEEGKFIEYWGSGKRFGIVPIGGGNIYCYATTNASRGDERLRTLNVNEFKQMMAEFKGPVQDVIRQLNDQSLLIHNDLEDLKLQKWHNKVTLLIGDAAHAVTPNMGQGACMAIEDAKVLLECLSAHDQPGEAFAAYQQRRYNRVKWIRDQSWRFGRIAQWENPLSCALRNATFRITPDRPFVKRMTKKLLGAI